MQLSAPSTFVWVLGLGFFFFLKPNLPSKAGGVFISSNLVLIFKEILLSNLNTWLGFFLPESEASLCGEDERGVPQFFG